MMWGSMGHGWIEIIKRERIYLMKIEMLSFKF